MRAGLKYEGDDHKKVTKSVYTVNNLILYLTENDTKFTAEEL